MENFLQLSNLFSFLVEGHGLEPDPWSTTLNKNDKTETNSAILQTADWKWELVLSHVSPSKVKQQLYANVINIDRGVDVDFNGSFRGTINAQNGHVLRPEKMSFIYWKVLKVQLNTVQWLTSSFLIKFFAICT